MKKRIICVVIAAILLFAAIPVSFADTYYYQFSGNAKRYFTTTGSLQKPSQFNWGHVSVCLNSLSYNGTPAYTYAVTVIVDAGGAVRSSYQTISVGVPKYMTLTGTGLSENQLKARLIHPYFHLYSETAASKMTVSGYVEGSPLTN